MTLNDMGERRITLKAAPLTDFTGSKMFKILKMFKAMALTSFESSKSKIGSRPWPSSF